MTAYGMQMFALATGKVLTGIKKSKGRGKVGWQAGGSSVYNSMHWR